ncbi:MAG: 16S rRNA (cytidine(1402)-2'-O)-methyltransferase, partial [Candidatus Caldatribacteriota bacterium]|nr:16S rRNA (cytidine(1402)-2'-O)-methyltransferase [Candidatus Caldatribacteriota bacterium]
MGKNSLKKNVKEGILFICGTPIGNLKDITLRVLDTLKEADLIAAEDTRHAQKLLNYYKIETKVTSYHEYNKLKKSNYLIKKIINGQKVALVSDAGMPGISDPGYTLINLAIENNLKITITPGVSAITTALVVSGFNLDKFVFEGFLPRTIKERKKYFKNTENEKRTVILYESPHRLKSSLKDMFNVWGDREIIIARELTKKYEEIIRGNLSKVINEINERKIKGEITLVIQGEKKKKGKNTNEFTENEKLI